MSGLFAFGLLSFWPLGPQCTAYVFQQALTECFGFRVKRNLKTYRCALGEHEIVRSAFGVARDTEIRPIADDRLALGESVAALPGGPAVGIGTVHAGDDQIGAFDRFH